MVNPQFGREAHFKRLFRNEVQAVARLNHPNIVTIFDYGEVSATAARASGGQISVGAPYLVMELVEGGNINDFGIHLSYTEIRPLLGAILDALAHAHARNLIHRDLKPGNVLYTGRPDRWSSVKLTDFGIAHATDRGTRTAETSATQSSVETIVGTPNYMAPEQFEGRFRDYGPWTDLYSLGCLIFQLVTGDGPFEGSTPLALAVAHLHHRPRPLPVGAGFPRGFDAWVGRLLHKDPYHRFSRAADALWALSQLERTHVHESGAHLRVSTKRNSLRTLELPNPMTGNATLAETPFRHATGSEVGAELPESSSGSKPDVLISFAPPPAPESWRRPGPVGVSARLPSTGLRLHGLRRTPFVDRTGERDTIWEALTQVTASGQSRAVVIKGDDGLGKSRLAEWMCQRADEVGAANVLKVVHSPQGLETEGIPRMIAAHLRAVGLNFDASMKRSQAFLKRHREDDQYLQRALAAIVVERSRTTGQIDPEARYAVLGRFVEVVSALRPPPSGDSPAPRHPSPGALRRARDRKPRGRGLQPTDPTVVGIE